MSTPEYDFGLDESTKEEKRKLEGLPDPRRKNKVSTKVLQRPRAIKDNRFLLDTTGVLRGS